MVFAKIVKEKKIIYNVLWGEFMSIRLESASTDEKFTIIKDMINENEEPIFFGDEYRVKTSEFVSLIKKDEKNIGFIYGVKENNTKFLMIDIGILKKYRGKGYGTEVLKKLQNIPYDKFFIAQVKKNNVLAVNQLQNNASYLVENNEYKYFLLQKDKLNDLKKDYPEEKLNNIFNGKSLDSRNIISQINEQEKVLEKRKF